MYSLKLYSDGRNQTLEQDIEQALFMICFTSPTERIYMPDYAAGALDYIDKPIWALQKLQVAIARSVSKYEPRVTLNEVQIINRDLAAGKIALRLEYRINDTGQYKSTFLTN